MKGYVELSQDNGLNLCIACLNAMDRYEYKYETHTVTRWFGLVKKEKKHCINTPHWYGYGDALKRKFNTLLKMLDKPDPVHLSLDCYSEMIKLSEGDRRANPIFILNY